MRRLIAVMAAVLCLLSMTACAANDQEEANVLDTSKDYRVLMIGNSYTYYYDLWDLFTQVAQSGGYTMTVDHVTQGGYYLDQYTTAGDPFAAQVETCFAESSYDFVILQEQSTNPIVNYERFEDGAKALYEKIEENGAACVLYQTWGRQEGSVTLQVNRWTHKGMTEDLKEAYEKLAETLPATVSPVGTAFYDINVHHEEINLYDPDTSHPSLAGSMLVAYCHYATLTGADPREVSFNAELSDEVADVLKQAAYDAVFPEE